jgi:hypothetical protein
LLVISEHFLPVSVDRYKMRSPSGEGDCGWYRRHHIESDVSRLVNATNGTVRVQTNELEAVVRKAVGVTNKSDGCAAVLPDLSCVCQNYGPAGSEGVPEAEVGLLPSAVLERRSNGALVGVAVVGVACPDESQIPEHD